MAVLSETETYRPHPDNARMLRSYVDHLRYAKGRARSTVEAAAAAVRDFELIRPGVDFREFTKDWAIQFKRWLDEKRSTSVRRNGLPIRASSRVGKLRAVATFLRWLRERRLYRRAIKLDDIDYLEPSLHDRTASSDAARRPAASVDDLRRMVDALDGSTIHERRHRAVIAFLLLTGARARAAVMMPIHDIDLAQRTVRFDPEQGTTKRGKGYTADFFPVGEPFEAIVRDWVRFLKDRHGWTDENPLFPPIEPFSAFRDHAIVTTPTGSAEPPFGSFLRRPLRSTVIVREAMAAGSKAAGLRYYNPHSVRTTLGHLGQKLCRTDEERKAWSQSLGHEHLDTTARYYSHLPEHTQSNAMQSIRARTEQSITAPPVRSSSFVSVSFEYTMLPNDNNGDAA